MCVKIVHPLPALFFLSGPGLSQWNGGFYRTHQESYVHRAFDTVDRCTSHVCHVKRDKFCNAVLPPRMPLQRSFSKCILSWNQPASGHFPTDPSRRGVTPPLASCAASASTAGRLPTWRVCNQRRATRRWAQLCVWFFFSLCVERIECRKQTVGLQCVIHAVAAAMLWWGITWPSTWSHHHFV